MKTESKKRTRTVDLKIDHSLDKFKNLTLDKFEETKRLFKNTDFSLLKKG